MTSVAALPHLSATSYQRHMLHAEERTWVEKNCYVDIWLEVIHALGLDPMAILAFTVAVDFEGDQWTFFKPPHDELWSLYGIDVQELNVWRPLTEHCVEYLRRGHLVSTEADAYWLPDTAGTDYRTQHTKTTIVVERIDVDARQLGYFHNAAYYELSGDDFDGLFAAVHRSPDGAAMPLYAELVRLDRVTRRTRDELVARSLEALAVHARRRPTRNPIDAFAARLDDEIPRIRERGLPYYHAFAFAATRQLGAAAELSALYFDWLERAGVPRFSTAARACERISIAAKALVLKGSRIPTSKRGVDLGGTFAELRAGWDEVSSALQAAVDDAGTTTGHHTQAARAASGR